MKFVHNSYETNEKLVYNCKDFECVFKDEDITCDVNATASYFYQPMVMYFSDGSGQPEDEDLEIDEVEISNAKWKDSGKPLSDEEVEELSEVITDTLYDMDWDEWEGWSDDYDYEDDHYDDWRERMEENCDNSIDSSIKSVRFVK